MSASWCPAEIEVAPTTGVSEGVDGFDTKRLMAPRQLFGMATAIRPEGLGLLWQVLDGSAVSSGVVDGLGVFGRGEGSNHVGAAGNAHQYRQVRDGRLWPPWPLAARRAGLGHSLIVREAGDTTAHKGRVKPPPQSPRRHRDRCSRWPPVLTDRSSILPPPASPRSTSTSQLPDRTVDNRPRSVSHSR